MQDVNPELLRFRRCSNLQGTSINLTIGRRNGKPAAFIRPRIEDSSAAPEPPEFTEQPKFFVNLNPLERETWRKILSGQSIASVAKDEGVSRAAIYSRIAGNAKGQGGMIAKNFWVLLWWRLRQRFFTTHPHA